MDGSSIESLCNRITKLCNKYPYLYDDTARSLENILYNIEGRVQQQQVNAPAAGKRSTSNSRAALAQNSTSITSSTRGRSGSLTSSNASSTTTSRAATSLSNNRRAPALDDEPKRVPGRRRPSITEQHLEIAIPTKNNAQIVSKVEPVTPETLEREFDNFILADSQDNSASSSPLYSPAYTAPQPSFPTTNNVAAAPAPALQKTTTAQPPPSAGLDFSTPSQSPTQRRRSLRLITGDFNQDDQEVANNKKEELRRALDEQVAAKKELKLQDMYPGSGNVSRPSSGVFAPSTPSSSSQPTYGRFKYSQASPEEQEALNRKFQAQQEFKRSLAMQVEEKKRTQSATPQSTSRDFGRTW